jgi:hypothetical protein
MGRRRQSGQASVETVGVAVGLALVALIGWQVLVAANAWQSVQHAARIAARAGQVGAPVERAALAALPGRLATRATITIRSRSNGERWVRVRVPIPRVTRWIGGLGTVTGDAKVIA